MSTPHADHRLDELERAFERATAVTGALTRRIQIADRCVELCFAGPVLHSQLTPAFAHLPIGHGAPALTLCVADAKSTGITPELQADAESADQGRRRVAEELAPRCIYVPETGALYAMDGSTRRGFFWAKSESALLPSDIAAPLRLLLAWWAAALGAQLAHGAVVGLPDVGILLTGRGGSGKSTSALSCMQRGLHTLGDDYVWIELGTSPIAFSLYSTAKIDRTALETHFSSLKVHAGALDCNKAILFLAHAPAVRFVSRLPLCAVAAQRISGRASPRIRTASPIEVLTALAPASLFQLPGSAPSALARLARLVRDVRSLVFDAGTDYIANAAAIAELLSRCPDPPMAEPHALALG